MLHNNKKTSALYSYIPLTITAFGIVFFALTLHIVRAKNSEGLVGGYTISVSPTPSETSSTSYSPSPSSTADTPVLGLIISNIKVTQISATKAVVSWNTNSASNSFVGYGENTSYGNAMEGEKSAMSHLVYVNNLKPNTLYHFNVSSRNESDVNAKSVNSPDNTFRTLSAGFKRGDANQDGKVDISDPSAINNYLNKGALFSCLDAADANDDGMINTKDSEYILNFLFNGGTAPAAPGAFSDGTDSTPDYLQCRDYNVDYGPVSLSNIGASSITSNSATVAWNTNYPASGYMTYSTDASVPTGSSYIQESGNYNSSHSIRLTGLLANTKYYYKVDSWITLSNRAISAVYPFTTLQAQASPSPSPTVTPTPTPATSPSISPSPTASPSATASPESGKTFKGDGTYRVVKGDTIIINNGGRIVVADLAYNNYGAPGTDNLAFGEIRFHIYGSNNIFVTTTPWLRPSSPNQIYKYSSVGNAGVSIVIGTIAGGSWSDVTASSYIVESGTPNPTPSPSASPSPVISYSCASMSITIPSVCVSLDSSSPSAGAVKWGQKDVVFAKIRLTASNLKTNPLDSIQVGTKSSDPNKKVTNIRVYNGNQLIASGLNTLFDNGEYFYTWKSASPRLEIPANSSVVLSIVGDILENSSGTINLGVYGLNFVSPGTVACCMPNVGSDMTIIGSGIVNPTPNPTASPSATGSPSNSPVPNPSVSPSPSASASPVIISPRSVPATFRRGDINSDGSIDLSDMVAMSDYLNYSKSLSCLDAADVNDDGVINLSDFVYLSAWYTRGGEEPPAPGPINAGEDPTLDKLGCRKYPITIKAKTKPVSLSSRTAQFPYGIARKVLTEDRACTADLKLHLEKNFGLSIANKAGRSLSDAYCYGEYPLRSIKDVIENGPKIGAIHPSLEYPVWKKSRDYNSYVSAFGDPASVTVTQTTFRRGDINSDGAIDISDILAFANYINKGEKLSCLDAADTNDDGAVDLSDWVNFMAWYNGSGDAPALPGPTTPGVDPTEDALSCAEYPKTQTKSVSTPKLFRRGDINSDGALDISDIVAFSDYLNRAKPLSCLDAADVNDDGRVNISDWISFSTWFTQGGAEPPAPGTKNVGSDPTPDDLGCDAYPA